MILLDSNILIEALHPDSDILLTWLESQIRFVSSVTCVEVLGYHRITGEDLRDMQILLGAITKILPTNEIINQAILLRQQRKMSLGDALIAATALIRIFLWQRGTRRISPGLTS